MTTIPHPALSALAAHATAKLKEEHAYHSARAKAGLPPDRRRHDRRTLWTATMMLSQRLAYDAPATALGLRSRQDAWGRLCHLAVESTANENQFEAIIELHEIMMLPAPEQAVVLAERTARREERERARCTRRVQQLRAEMIRLEAALERDVPIPDNVVRLTPRA